MGILDWIFKRRRGGSNRQPRVVGGLDDDSMFVLVEDDSGMITAMDRDMFDYQYGESDAPDPRQSDVDELFSRITRVRVQSGGLSRGEPLGGDLLLEVDDAEAIVDLKAGLRVVEDPETFGHCACPGGPTLILESDNGTMESISLQHGRAVRWRRWKHDAQLVEGDLSHCRSLTRNCS